MPAYFASLARVRGPSSKALTLGTLPAVEVGLGEAPTGVSSAWEAMQRWLDGGGFLCTWRGKSSPWVIRRCLFIGLGVIPRSEKEGTKPTYVCPGCSNHTHDNNMINRCNVINKRVICLT
jgi:hypothetical protein